MEVVLEEQQLVRLGPTGGLSRFSLQTLALEVKGIVRQGSLQECSGPSVAVEGGVGLLRNRE